MQTDQALLTRLAEDPREGIAEVMEQYTGLVWSVAAQYLDNPEDIRECVNDTFTEFYGKRAAFDPEKGTLKQYLAGIARHRAVDRYRAGQRQLKTGPLSEALGEETQLGRVEDRTALSAALDSLPQQDEAILRMKYYGGMSFREIAASLNLPYETVKKRHQRSLGRMRKFLLAGLILALLALLAACVYFVARYFGLIPGYGVNSDPAGAVYVLDEPSAAAAEEGEIQVEDAWWQDGKLTVLVARYGEFRRDQVLDAAVEGLEDAQILTLGHTPLTDVGRDEYRLVFTGELPEGTQDTLSLTLTVAGRQFRLTLEKAEETELEEAGFYSLTEEGGLLAVPRLENGELIVSIYPLNTGEFRTEPMLTKGGMDDYGGPERAVTVTAPDGRVLEGTLRDDTVSPDEGDGCLEWSFGPAEPGEYTLNVPYLLQYPAEGETETFELPLEEGEVDAALDLPGGTLKLEELTRVEDPTKYSPSMWDGYSRAGYRWWALECTWEGENPERSPAAVHMRPEFSGYLELDGVNFHHIVSEDWMQPCRDSETGREYGLWQGCLVGAMEGCDTAAMTVDTGAICYRWNHPFAIPMTVDPEPERETFTQMEGYYGLTAVPRRERSGVILDLHPRSDYDGLDVLPGIAHSPLTGAEDQPVTLTGADGSLWTGTFRPSRDGTYSEWAFGDIPAGEYTLHVPYLYLVDNRQFHAAVPLPRAAGETLPVGDVLMNGCVLRLHPISGLGEMEEYDESKPYLFSIIGQPDGSVTDSQGRPLQARLELSYPTSQGEFMTLLDVGVRLGMTAEGSEGTACQMEYTPGEDGVRLSALLLRYKPELYAADLTFVHPVFRMNHAFDIPVRIPE